MIKYNQGKEKPIQRQRKAGLEYERWKWLAIKGGIVQKQH